MVLTCPLCGAELGTVSGDQPEREERACPGCGAELVLRRVDERVRDGDAGTFFHPRVMVERAPPAEASTVDLRSATQPARRPEQDAAVPDLPPGPEAFFMVLGAPAGRERIRLERARTVFGRAAADVDLADPDVAERHFQVEVMGREYFLRDLESADGTRLNGRAVRYTELLPGDEVAAGATVLVFRTSDDGVSRRRP